MSAYSFFSGEEKDFESLPIIIASGLGFQLSGALAWYLFRQMVPYKNENRPEGFSRAVTIGAIGFVSVYLALIPVTFAWKSVLELLNFEYEFQLPVLLVQNGGTALEMSLMALLIVVVAPICEEIVYRGFVYRYLNERVSIGLAIVLSAGIFALMHLNLYSFLPLLTLGIALSIVYRISGNIVSSITIHMLFNLVNLVMIYYTEPIQI